jgi:hypothetical protein
MPATVRQESSSRVLSSEIFRIAQADAERAYRSDMSEYRVTLLLRDDGWHVDYDLIDTNLHGGGPHYIIDPITGQILHKRYEQ